MPEQERKNGRTHIDGLAEMMQTVEPSAMADFIIFMAWGRMMWALSFANASALDERASSFIPAKI